MEQRSNFRQQKTPTTLTYITDKLNIQLLTHNEHFVRHETNWLTLLEGIRVIYLRMVRRAQIYCMAKCIYL